MPYTRYFSLLPLWLCALVCAAPLVANAQRPTPAPAQTQSIVLVGATAHLGNGQVIPNAAIGFKEGKLTLVADATKSDAAIKTYERVIDVTGKQLYPGFIAPNTLLGLRDIDAVRAQEDNVEVGAFNPNVHSITAYNTDARILPTIRSNGVLLAESVPLGGTISGTSSVVELDGWSTTDVAYKVDNGVHLNWATIYARGGWWAEPEPTVRNKKYDEQVTAIKQFFEEARAYCEAPETPKPEHANLRFEAMRGIFTRKQTLFIHAHEAKAIIEAVLFAENYKARVVVVYADDALRIADFLKAHNVAVVLGETNRLPTRDDDDIDAPYRMPALLHEKGLLFSFSIFGGWEQRDFVFQAGQAIGFGLPYEAAVEAGTLSAAKILGIDATVGSLEVGKDATLIVSEGDVFEPRTQKIGQAFIRGKAIDLDNCQKQLYRQYNTRYGGKDGGK